jgi:hypothetical protein
MSKNTGGHRARSRQTGTDASGVPRGCLAARDLYASTRRGAGQSARLFREVSESGLHDGNRILARTLQRPHRIHDAPPAQRRLIARGKERCCANAVCLRTFRQTARSCVPQPQSCSLLRPVAMLEFGPPPPHLAACSMFWGGNDLVAAGFSHTGVKLRWQP